MLQGGKETQEGWYVQSVCWNPQTQNQEEISTVDEISTC